MRIGVVDIGTNSTRLLVADVDPATGAMQELDRRTIVTRLGQGVDETGALADEAMDRVDAALDQYTEVMDRLGVEARPTRPHLAPCATPPTAARSRAASSTATASRPATSPATRRRS